MAVLIWCLVLMLTALTFALAIRRSPEPRPAPVTAASAPVALPALRPAPRAAIQTSAALLALALALDVSNPAPAFAAPVEPDGVYVAQAHDAYVLPEAEPYPWTSVELASDWAYKAVNATDGWLI